MNPNRCTSNRSRAPLACATLALALAGAGMSAARADTPQVPGHAVVARPENDALVIWDATLEVSDIVKNKVDDATAKDRLERDALNELVLEQPKLSNLKSVEVRVVYTKTGDVSPVYGTATFAGVERYATLTMSDADLKSDRDKWKEAAAGSGALPSWVTFSAAGELPPR